MNKIKNIFPELVYLILLISTGLVPNYGAIDRVATQWLYLSLLNTLGISIFLFDKKYNDVLNIKSFFKFKPFLFLILFIGWGLLSYFYAINSTEVIIKFIRWIQLPLSLLILMIFIRGNRLDFLIITSMIVAFVLLIELYFSYSTYFDLIKFTRYNFSYANIIKGATGNKNINAASVLIKAPFVILLFFRFKTFIIKLFLAIIVGLSFFLVLILSARAAIISLIIISLLLLVKFIIYYVSNKRDDQWLSMSLIMISILLPILLFSVKYSSNSASIVNRVSTINTEDTSTQQRIRYYQHSVTQLFNNPMLGVGSGNWKIKSIEYDKKNVRGYTIPYHTHNDFLEIGAELGLIGLLLYLMIFFKPLVTVLKRKTLEKPFNVNTLILLSGIVYFIDANLNFPHARPVMQIPFLLLLAFSFHNSINSKEHE